MCLFLSLCLINPFSFQYRSVRFRWYQGFFSTGSSPPTWALDNIYIGPQCQDMCNGHGACVGGSHCVCDLGYSGSDCSVPDTPNPDFLKEDFEGTPIYKGTFNLIIFRFCFSIHMVFIDHVTEVRSQIVNVDVVLLCMLEISFCHHVKCETCDQLLGNYFTHCSENMFWPKTL